MNIVLAATFFTVFVVLLAGLVLIMRRWLVPVGEVTVMVNSDRALTAQAGDKLLGFLATQGIQLPAACGGRGSCGQCRVVVNRGERPLTATESNHIDRREAEHGVRLACMLTVREDLGLTLPPDVLDARRWRGTVRSNGNVTTFLTELIVDLDEPIAFESGDYVLLEAPPYTLDFRDIDVEPEYVGEWEHLSLFDFSSTSAQAQVRAYSIANPPGESAEITLVVRVAPPPPHAPPNTPPGIVSSYVFGLKPGEEVVLSGPFGDFHVQESNREIVFIGGGAGIAPLRSMIFDQLERAGTQRRISFWYGARNEREICYRDDFDRLARSFSNFTWHVVLSDLDPDAPWTGHRGFVHAAVRDGYLSDHPAPEDLEYYLCGPPVMSRAVLAMLEDLGVDRSSVFFDDFGQ